MHPAALALLTALLGPAASADADPLLPRYPTAEDLPGLKAQGPSRFCGGGEDLAALYDGGYQRYLDAGVIRASQRLFSLAGQTLQISLHEMKTSEAAAKFLASLCQDNKVSVLSERRPEGQIASCAGRISGTWFGYMAAGRLLAMASLDRAEDATVRRLRQTLSARLLGSGASSNAPRRSGKSAP